jgi:hypothetical protein
VPHLKHSRLDAKQLAEHRGHFQSGPAASRGCALFTLICRPSTSTPSNAEHAASIAVSSANETNANPLSAQSQPAHGGSGETAHTDGTLFRLCLTGIASGHHARRRDGIHTHRTCRTGGEEFLRSLSMRGCQQKACSGLGQSDCWFLPLHVDRPREICRQKPHPVAARGPRLLRGEATRCRWMTNWSATS